MDGKKLSDPTGLGLPDIDRKLLRTPLKPALTLGNDNKRVARIPYLAAKLGFEVEPAIIDWVRKNPTAINNAKPRYVSQKLEQALAADSEKTTQLLDAMKLWHEVPMTETLIPYASQYGRA
jgi:tRNA nucleotidyltransferase/poly(A) polymerase